MSENKSERIKIIKKFYLDGSKSQQEMSDMLGITLGAFKNYVFRNKINKKKYQRDKELQVYGLYNNHVPVETISKIFETSTQNVYIMLKKARERKLNDENKQ